MKALVRYVSRRPNGAVQNRDELVEGVEIGIGRGAGDPIHLPDLRVNLDHGTIRVQDGHVVLKAIGNSNIRVNGQSIDEASIVPDDLVDIGPYRLRLMPRGDLPPEGPAAFGMTVELVAPPEDDEGRIRAKARLGMAAALPGKRPVAWALSLVVLIGFFVLPLVSFVLGGSGPVAAPGRSVEAMAKRQDPLALDVVWTSGAISGPHKFFAEDCTACHQLPFIMVRDSACVACHTGIQHHADPAGLTMASLTETRCASCHKEHEGLHPVVQDDQRLCSDCHGNLKDSLPKTDLMDAWAFSPTGHPQFRYAVVTDATAGKVERLPWGGPTPLVERSNLKFPHEKHMNPKGVLGPDGTKKLEVLGCGSCHEAEPGGVTFRPTAFEDHCSRCHTLKFDPDAPTRVVPHANTVEVAAVVRDHFATAALASLFQDVVTVEAAYRRQPGKLPTEEQRASALQAAGLKTDQALQRLASDKGCGTCHAVTAEPPKAEVGAKFGIAPVRVAEFWLPKSVFNHKAHETSECGVCHAAATSKVATDVLMTGIETCHECHGPQGASDKVPSPCVDCHVFHQPHLPPMRPQTVSAP